MILLSTPDDARDLVCGIEKELVRRGLHCRIDPGSCGDDDDIRLAVDCGPGAPVVELLVPCGAAGQTGAPLWWDAVRISAGFREVWRGLPHPARSSDLVQFVADLLTPNGQELPTRWKRLG